MASLGVTLLLCLAARNGPVTLDMLAAEIRLAQGTELTIAYAGLSPESSPGDARLVAYLKITKSTTVLVPDGKFVTEVRNALASKPRVLVVNEKLFRSLLAPDQRAQAEQAFADCWRSACLPVVVTAREIRPDLRVPGAMYVSVVDGALVDLSNPTVADTNAALVVLAELLKTRSELSPEHALLAYTGLAAARIPADGPLAHLERASGLWLRSPIRTDGKKTYRVLDVRTAADPNYKGRFLALTGDQIESTDRLADLKNVFMHDRGAPERKILAAVFKNNKLAHLDVAARLAGLTPTVLTRTGTAIYLLDGDGDRAPIVTLLSAHMKDKDDPGVLFFVVSKNTIIKR